MCFLSLEVSCFVRLWHVWLLFFICTSSPPPAAASLEPITSFSTQSNSLYSAYDIRTVNISFGPVKIVIPSTGGVTPLIANTTAMRGFSQVWHTLSAQMER